VLVCFVEKRREERRRREEKKGGRIKTHTTGRIQKRKIKKSAFERER
jgi:hypothetical protein